MAPARMLRGRSASACAPCIPSCAAMVPKRHAACRNCRQRAQADLSFLSEARLARFLLHVKSHEGSVTRGGAAMIAKKARGVPVLLLLAPALGMEGLRRE